MSNTSDLIEAVKTARIRHQRAAEDLKSLTASVRAAEKAEGQAKKDLDDARQALADAVDAECGLT